MVYAASLTHLAKLMSMIQLGTVLQPTMISCSQSWSAHSSKLGAEHGMNSFFLMRELSSKHPLLLELAMSASLRLEHSAGSLHFSPIVLT